MGTQNKTHGEDFYIDITFEETPPSDFLPFMATFVGPNSRLLSTENCERHRPRPIAGLGVQPVPVVYRLSGVVPVDVPVGEYVLTKVEFRRPNAVLPEELPLNDITYTITVSSPQVPAYLQAPRITKID
jgi:hypothetical protein